MKVTASNTTRQAFTQLCQHLHLGKTLGDAYSAGALSADYKRASSRAGWSTQQLLVMSAAKSLFN